MVYTGIISNLEMKGVHGLYANTTPFYIRNLSIPVDSGIHGGTWNQYPMGTEGLRYVKDPSQAH